MNVDLEVIWHDLECGGYDADLPLWRELAAETAGPILEIGAGTGRVALHLAAHGANVTALDSDADLLATLARRARYQGLEVQTALGDAREVDLGMTFATILVPMQTLQIIGGASGRARLLSVAHAHLRPGGLLAAALADAPEAYAGDPIQTPLPDVCEIDGTVYSSRAVAVMPDREHVGLVRVREIVPPDGTMASSTNIVALERAQADTVAREATVAGFRVLAPRRIPETHDYVGSTVVMLRA